MGRAYLPAFGFLFAVGFLEWLIPSEFTKMSSLIQLAIGIACAIAAKPLTEAQICSRETGLRERLEESGHTGALLEMELRVRERGGTGESVLVMFGLLTLYFLVFAAYFFALNLMSEAFSPEISPPI